MPAIEVDHLHKTYRGRVAVQDVSFTVKQGEIFGLLGPNGAGKTTTVECLVGLRRRDSGSIRVLVLDPDDDRDRLREQVGVQLQESQLPDNLRVAAALRLYASFYPDLFDWQYLLETIGLADKADTPYRKLSGGQRQRLSIALSLVGNPRAAVLDELTIGLDPAALRDAWQVVDEVRRQGVTVLLITHFMPEAESLCDRVALLDAG